MQPLKRFICKYLAPLFRPCLDEEQFQLYHRLCLLNKELADEVERRMAVERELASRNRILMAHNAKLREIVQTRLLLEDTALLTQTIQQMVNDMKGMVDVASASYVKQEAEEEPSISE